MADDQFDALEREIWEHVFRLSPLYGVNLGLHEYDGLVPDLSTAGTEAWVARSRVLHERLARASSQSLAPRRRTDKEVLTVMLEAYVLEITDYPYYDKLPGAYVYPLSLIPYMTRSYATPLHRARAILEALRGAPALLRTGINRLRTPLPRPFISIGLSMASGMKDHFHDAVALVDELAPQLSSEGKAAYNDAVSALEEFIAHLGKEMAGATDDFALGPERFHRLISVKERLTLSNDELWQLGWDDLKRNQQRLRELASKMGFSEKPREAIRSFAHDHPSENGLLDEAREYVTEMRAFVLDKDLVTIPQPEECKVTETPSFERTTTTAALQPAPPFEKGEDQGIYYVTPVEASWDERKKKEWLEYFNRPLFRNVTAHEVYPGHHLQFLHQKRSPTLTGKAYFSGAFAEGWAHYVEELMIEQGYRSSHPESEVSQIQDALLRDCRLLVSVGMHTRGMSLKEATDLFVRESFMDAFPAEREALRGTFNPEYFCYTLGKLTIRDVRKKYMETHPKATLKEFHDLILSHGSPPVGLLSGLMLGK
jgi:uncharacterized protein (DUF885 family)